MVNFGNGTTSRGQPPNRGTLDSGRPVAGGQDEPPPGEDSSGFCERFYNPANPVTDSVTDALGILAMCSATTRRDHPLSTSPSPALITFDDVLLAFLTANAGEKSAVRDRCAAVHLFPAFTGQLWAEIQSHHVRQYLRSRKDAGAAMSTVNKEIGLLSRAARYMSEERGCYVTNPALGLKQREPEGRVRWLTKAQAQLLIAQAGQLGPRAGHLPTLITLALNTGMRKGELLGLEWARVDFAHGLIYLEAGHTKGNRRRSIPINRLAQGALESCQARCPGRFVFGGIKDVKRSFTHACQLAGIEDFRFHDLRHTFASWLVQAGAPLTEVRDLLGHASIEMTERYAHLAPERLRGTVARLEG